MNRRLLCALLLSIAASVSVAPLASAKSLRIAMVLCVLADREPVLKINGATSRALGVTIPDAVRKRAVIVE